MLQLQLALALLVQDPVVVTSGRDRPAAHQVFTTAGRCGDVPVSVALEDSRRDVSVSIGSLTRSVTSELPELQLGEGGRWVARTYLVCLKDGSLEVSLLLADGRDERAVQWSLTVFTVGPGLRDVRWRADYALSASDAAAAVR